MKQKSFQFLCFFIISLILNGLIFAETTRYAILASPEIEETGVVELLRVKLSDVRNLALLNAKLTMKQWKIFHPSLFENLCILCDDPKNVDRKPVSFLMAPEKYDVDSIPFHGLFQFSERLFSDNLLQQLEKSTQECRNQKRGR